MQDDYTNLFDDDGEMIRPTMRGSANLDPQDYAIISDEGTFLDDDIQEVPPPRQSGAAPATDVEGTSRMSFLEEKPGPGMDQTTYGSHPWQIGAGGGYRPFSQQTTGLSGDSSMPKPSTAIVPAVANPDSSLRVDDFRPSERNAMPSNADIDPETLYDRESYEYNESPGAVIGSGIFEMEEGVTFRPRDGIFANQYAMPSYLVDEDPEGVQQSDMWDVEADNWRVTQVNASGVPLSRRVSQFRGAPRQFAPPNLRPDRVGPRSHVEAFGRRAARCILVEAQMQRTGSDRIRFVNEAMKCLGPDMAKRSKAVADRLVSMGYPAQFAVEDVLAHCVMHAAMCDLFDGGKRAGTLPRLDKMASKLKSQQPEIRRAAAEHLQPLSRDTRALHADVSALKASRAAMGLGEIENATVPPEPEAPSAPPPVPAASAAAATTPQNSITLFTPRNVVIGVGVMGLLYLAATRTEAGQAVTANIKSGLHKLTGTKRRSKSRR